MNTLIDGFKELSTNPVALVAACIGLSVLGVMIFVIIKFVIQVIRGKIK